jgi:hypothetical protein
LTKVRSGFAIGDFYEINRELIHEVLSTTEDTEITELMFLCVLCALYGFIVEEDLIKFPDSQVIRLKNTFIKLKPCGLQPDKAKPILPATAT